MTEEDRRRGDGDQGDILASIRRIVREEAEQASSGTERRDGVLPLTPSMRVAAGAAEPAPKAPPEATRDEAPEDEAEVLVLSSDMRVDAPPSPSETPAEAPAPEPVPEPAASETAAPSEPEPTPAPEAPPPAAESPRPEPVAPEPVAPAAAAPSPAAPSPAAPSPAAASAGPSVRDAFSEDAARLPAAVRSEAALRALVREILREELSGELGERVSRNIRVLVEREIRRILAEADGDDRGRG